MPCYIQSWTYRGKCHTGYANVIRVTVGRIGVFPVSNRAIKFTTRSRCRCRSCRGSCRSCCRRCRWSCRRRCCWSCCRRGRWSCRRRCCCRSASGFCIDENIFWIWFTADYTQPMYFIPWEQGTASGVAQMRRSGSKIPLLGHSFKNEM